MSEVPSVTLLKTTEPEDDQLVPLSTLWHAISTSHHQQIDGTRDLFQELQDALASDEALFSMPVSPLNASLSDDITSDSESDFSIELSDHEFDETSQSSSAKMKVSVNSLTYPWLTKGRCYEEVKEMAGDPTDRVTSLGNVFYINDVAKVIAKDYANPLT
ncbi:hypothetical protein EDD16DRAFT_1716068 [Pisolithus croceorrhizus]|nr:hypothetical protein EDD16DRAFT_1716068 [Pisolithus croceorrhizus]KAI6116975.1 hypothetical protein EV401DRAFT_2073037 [Pisolithus croceorrhizus]KAI6162818.1 hypothetical protein EDD17DRAFT_1756836 [Pisolithus thermaeus]